MTIPTVFVTCAAWFGMALLLNGHREYGAHMGWPVRRWTPGENFPTSTLGIGCTLSMLAAPPFAWWATGTFWWLLAVPPLGLAIGMLTSKLLRSFAPLVAAPALVLLWAFHMLIAGQID